MQQYEKNIVNVMSKKVFDLINSNHSDGLSQNNKKEINLNIGEK